MKHFIIEDCKCGHEWCSFNTDNFIFYHNLKFYLITSSICLGFNNLDSKEALLNQFLKSKTCDLLPCKYYNDGRIALDESFRKYRLENLSLKRVVHEINLIYRPVGRDLKCISTNVKYLDFANGQKEMHENFIEARDYLTQISKAYLIKELEDIYRENIIVPSIFIEREVVKSLDHLLKQIKDEINN